MLDRRYERDPHRQTPSLDEGGEARPARRSRKKNVSKFLPGQTLLPGFELWDFEAPGTASTSRQPEFPLGDLERTEGHR